MCIIAVVEIYQVGVHTYGRYYSIEVVYVYGTTTMTWQDAELMMM